MPTDSPHCPQPTGQPTLGLGSVCRHSRNILLGSSAPLRPVWSTHHLLQGRAECEQGEYTQTGSGDYGLLDLSVYTAHTRGNFCSAQLIADRQEECGSPIVSVYQLRCLHFSGLPEPPKCLCCLLPNLRQTWLNFKLVLCVCVFMCVAYTGVFMWV